MTLHQYEISIRSLIPNIILYRNLHWHLKMLAPLSSKFIAGDFTLIWFYIFVLHLGCWLLSHYLGCWKQQLASSCTHNVSRGFQATHENLLVRWKLKTYVLFLNEFLFDCLLELFCFIGYFYWDWSLFDTQLIPRKIRKIAHQSLPTRKKAHKVNHLCNKRYIYLHAQRKQD